MCQLIPLYRRQSVNRKISIVFITSLLIVFAFLSISFAIQYFNIKNYQQEVPKQFFRSYNKQSLETIAIKTKGFILSIIDYRMSLIASVRNILVSNSLQLVANASQQYTQPTTGPKQVNTMSCELTKPNATIFSCGSDIYVRILLEEAWNVHSRRNAKRFNILYQNNNDETDVMAKSISETPDFTLPSTAIVTQKLSQVRDGFLKTLGFYKDEYGNTPQRLSSYLSKIVFQNYTILLELQTFQTFIKNPATRLLYSDDANTVILSKNRTSPVGYNIKTNFEPLDPGLNYTALLQLGYASSTLPNGKIVYSYSLPLSTEFRVGSLNYLNQEEINDESVIIIHSPSVSGELEEKTNNFIDNLHRALNKILALFFGIFCVLLIANSTLLSYKIGRLIRRVIQSIKQYSQRPEEYYRIKNRMLNLSIKDQIVKPILRNLENVMKNIELKKKKFKNKSRIVKMDKFPLNLLQEQFIKEHQIPDEELFQELRLKIIKKIQSPIRIEQEFRSSQSNSRRSSKKG